MRHIDLRVIHMPNRFQRKVIATRTLAKHETNELLKLVLSASVTY